MRLEQLLVVEGDRLAVGPRGLHLHLAAAELGEPVFAAALDLVELAHGGGGGGGGGVVEERLLQLARLADRAAAQRGRAEREDLHRSHFNQRKTHRKRQ